MSPPPFPRRRSFGPHTGVGSFFGGIGFVCATPSVWPYACVPVLMVLLLSCGLGVGGYFGAGRLARAVTESGGGQTALHVLFTLLFLGLAGLVGLVLAQP